MTFSCLSALPMLAQTQLEPSDFWMTIERPTIHLLPLEAGAAS